MVLCKKSEILKLGLTEPQADLLLENFCRVVGLNEDFEGSRQKMKSYVLNNPNGADKFVLKPQREGGGNNYYDEDVLQKIMEFDREVLNAHILMDRVYPKKEIGIFTDGLEIYVDQVITEFGFYSWFVAQKDENGKVIGVEHG